MKITEGLLGEHALSHALFARVEAIVDEAQTLAELVAAESVLSSAVLSHARVEDEVLFPALAEGGLVEGPLNVMRSEHKEIELLAAAVRSSLTLDEAKEVVLRLLDLLREHFGKEEQVLFPMCERMLGERKLMELGERWAKLRGLS